MCGSQPHGSIASTASDVKSAFQVAWTGGEKRERERERKERKKRKRGEKE
jgi:hypothetical protein